MKKNLLILAFAAPFAFGQTTTFFVGSGADVKVKPNTLLYSGGKLQVAEGDGTVSNEGHVKVDGDFKGTSTGARFVNEFTNGTEYGQLIIKDDKTVTDKMTGKYKFTAREKFLYHPLAVPYTGYTAGDAIDNVGLGKDNVVWMPNKKINPNRYKSAVFTVVNRETRSDNPGKDEVLSPTGSHSINQYTNKTIDNSQAHSFIGVPAAGAHELNLTSYTLDGKVNTDRNLYNEYLGALVIDATRTMPTNWNKFKSNPGTSIGKEGYGDNLFSFGNPYTSNLDLTKLPATVVDAVIVYSEATHNEFYSENANTQTAQGLVRTPGGNAGDEMPIIRPYQVFDLRLSSSATQQTVTLNDNYKTFSANTNSPELVYNRPNATRDTRATDNTLYQVGFDLYYNNEKTDNRFYVAASNIYQDQGQSEYEMYNLWLGDGIGFYSLQEKADGTIAEHLVDQKVYLNGINATDYVAKPVHVVFQGKNDKEFTLKARLNDALLNSNNKFYFEDKKEGKVIEVTPDFEYTFVETEVNKDRFVVYWNGLPSTLGTQEVASSSKTQVYKDGQDHKVRFATEFKKADVYVYDLNGRLISSEKAVNTSVDYTLPYLSNANVYVVKVVGDNGVVTTQKIIK